MIRNLCIGLMSLFVLCCRSNNFKSGDNEKTVQLASYTVSTRDSSLIDSFMQYCYHSAYYFKKNVAMEGVVFFLRYESKVYLFSTLHNFTGMDPETKTLIDDLPNVPTNLWVWQMDWGNSNRMPGYNEQFSRWGKDYVLYKNGQSLFMAGSRESDQQNDDIGALNVSDSIPFPKHVLDYDKTWSSENIQVGDTIFYWGFTLAGFEQSKMPERFMGKITIAPAGDDPIFVSDILSGPGSSGAAVFKISKHKVSLVGLITRGNLEKNLVYITSLKKFSFKQNETVHP